MDVEEANNSFAVESRNYATKNKQYLKSFCSTHVGAAGTSKSFIESSQGASPAGKKQGAKRLVFGFEPINKDSHLKPGEDKKLRCNTNIRIRNQIPGGIRADERKKVPSRRKGTEDSFLPAVDCASILQPAMTPVKKGWKAACGERKLH